MENWFSLYEKAVESFRTRLPSSRGVAVAFNTNIDGIVKLSQERLGEFLSSQAVARDAFAKRGLPPGRINEAADFVVGLMHFIELGQGGEYMVYDEDTYDWIVSNFPIDHYRMGGGAGIMTNALSMLGASFVIPHAVQLPEKQARLFLDKDNIMLPVNRGDQVIFAPPRRASRPERELVHLIIEFKEGISADWEGHEIVSPRSNRFIVNADDYNGKIIIDPTFVKGIDVKLGEIDKFIFAGLHMLKRNYPDGTTYMDRLRESLGLVGGWTQENPRMKVHFEMGDLPDQDIRSDILEMGCRVANSIGMNEDEFQTITGVEGLTTAGPERILECMFQFLSSREIGKIMIHTRDFVISLASESYGVPPGVIGDAQMLGILTSQYRAHSGDFGSVDDLQGILSPQILEVSRFGLEVYERFVEAFGKPQNPGIWHRRFDQGEAWVVLTPCLLSMETLDTVGLCDCFTAGTVLSEIS
jgi:ADP-dependent phosphofructokinase/glucokinase